MKEGDALGSALSGDAEMEQLLDQKNPLLDRRYRPRAEPPPTLAAPVQALMAETREATPQYTLDVVPGAMEAYLTLFPPAPKTKLIDFSTLTGLLKKKIRVGLLEPAVKEALQEVARSGKTVEKILVAKGVQAEAGRDSELELKATFLESAEFRQKHPDVDLDQLEGSRDFHKIARVQSGDIVARFRPAFSGKVGATVTGVGIPVTKGRPLHLIGPNLLEEADTDGWFLWKSEAEGIAVVLGQRIAVLTYSDVLMKLTFEEGEYSAMLHLTAPTGLWKPPTLEAIQNLLNKEGIIWGVDEAGLKAGWKQFLDTGKSHAFLVARGIKPADGPPASVTWHVNLEYGVLLKEDALGRVDHKARRNVIQVGTGTHLCTLTHQDAESRNGMTVKGKVVTPRSVKTLPVIAGEGVEERKISDRVFEYWSNRDGEVLWDSKRREIRISRSKTVDAVDIALGHLSFTGDVVVAKNIEDGMRVTITGNLHVKGQIMAARVEVSGHLICEGGIHTGRTGLVRCGGDLEAAYIENSVIRCGGQLTVLKDILGSRISVLGDLHCFQDKSQLVGGIMQVKGNLHLFNLGRDTSVQTIVHVGVDAEALERYHVLIRQIKDLQAEGLGYDGEIANLSAAATDEGLKIRLKEVLLKRKELLTRILAARTEAKNLHDLLASPSQSTLTIDGKAWAHHVIRFGGDSLELTREYQAIRFFQDPETREIKHTSLTSGTKASGGKHPPAPGPT